MTEQTPALLTCCECGEEIDCCAFCDEAACGVAICHECLNVTLGQAMPNLHLHGG